MDLPMLADYLEANVKDVKRFLRLPQWQVIDVTRLDESSYPVIKIEFDKWYGPRSIKCPEPVLVISESKEEPEVIDLPDISYARYVGRQQEAWLQARLYELGLSVPKQRSNVRPLGRYDTRLNGKVSLDED